MSRIAGKSFSICRGKAGYSVETSATMGCRDMYPDTNMNPEIDWLEETNQWLSLTNRSAAIG
jgi:hypothetical protein